MAEKRRQDKEDTRRVRIINRVRDKAKDVYDLGKTKVIYAKERTEDKIKEHPLESVLIAAGVGALVGAAVALMISSKFKR